MWEGGKEKEEAAAAHLQIYNLMESMGKKEGKKMGRAISPLLALIVEGGGGRRSGGARQAEEPLHALSSLSLYRGRGGKVLPKTEEGKKANTRISSLNFRFGVKKGSGSKGGGWGEGGKGKEGRSSVPAIPNFPCDRK